MLRLEVLDFAGPTRWRWRLTEPVGGGFVADHDVVLDESEWQYKAFTDLARYLRRNAVSDRRLVSEAELITSVGAWIGERVLGPVGVALTRARQVVRLEVPPGAEVLAYLPWELAQVEGQALVVQRVSFVIDQFARPLGAKAPIGDRLRMLAVFSLPKDASALNLRRERHALAQLVQEIAAVNGKAIELRVLQYGATRARLEDALLEAPGWDVLHVSGHGLPAGLVLEDDAGRRDVVSSRELVELLELGADQIKLVTLSACESAAVTAAEHLRLLKLRPPAAADEADRNPTPLTNHGQVNSPAAGADVSAGRSLPAVATELVRRLDCAVLAMRYPVVDDFAIALAGSFYRLLLGKGQPVARALGLTLPRVVHAPPMPGAPALSIGTPALFGARAAELTLSPPPGKPLVFHAERQKLALFPPQPDRFVGRVGSMTRATTVLAPYSGRNGVLFHGMAGAGKTACALELAYTHESSFARLVWHRAPAEGHDITTALTTLALEFEAQLPGLRMVHLVNDTEALRTFLPVLTKFLQKERVLVVLDNLESLLTEDGQWRDQRWELLIDALCGSGGFSKVVLTSRRRPAGLQPGIVIEPVHALSLAEAVLLAREWPHLRALLDATRLELSGEQAHNLAARTLAVVQGHPKLLELANGQAADPTTLQAHLDEADRSWLTTGARLNHFLDCGQSTATDLDYLRVLDGWTRGTTTTLPEDAATLFAFLCCLEEHDRFGAVIDGSWTDVWHSLGKPGPSPDLTTALEALAERALLAIDYDPDTGQPQRFHIHPSVAESGRSTTSPDFIAAVDTQLADFWLRCLKQSIDHENEEMGRLILRSARAAAPYLIRQRRWGLLREVLVQVWLRDQSPFMIAVILPLLHAAADATRGTDLRLITGRAYATALATTRPEEAESRLRELLEVTVTRKDYEQASAITGKIINLRRNAGHLDEALNLVEVKKDYSRRAGHGPWTQLGNEGRRLQVLGLMGHAEHVLTAVQQLRTSMDSLPEFSDQLEAVIPWNVREGILDIGRDAARDLGQWEQALDLNTEIRTSMYRRGATDTDHARAAFNDYTALLGLGKTAQAEKLLLWCRDVFETGGQVKLLGMVLTALATVADRMDHGDRAIQLAKDGLRFIYTSRDPEAIGVGHYNLACYLCRYGDDAQQVWAHSLASAMISYHTGSGALIENIHALARLLIQNVESAEPASFAQVCQVTARVDGVHLEELVAGLPQQALSGHAAMTKILRRARNLPIVKDLVSGLMAADGGDPAAAETVDRALTLLGAHEDSQQLVAVLRRIRIGERVAALRNGLDPIDTTIVQRTLDAMTGVPANTDATNARQPHFDALAAKAPSSFEDVCRTVTHNITQRDAFDPDLFYFCAKALSETTIDKLLRQLRGDADGIASP